MTNSNQHHTVVVFIILAIAGGAFFFYNFFYMPKVVAKKQKNNDILNEIKAIRVNPKVESLDADFLREEKFNALTEDTYDFVSPEEAKVGNKDPFEKPGEVQKEKK